MRIGDFPSAKNLKNSVFEKALELRGQSEAFSLFAAPGQSDGPLEE